MSEGELEEIINHWWPLVLRRVMADGSDDWIKGFAKSIARHSKRSGWRPTDRQAQVMRALVADVRTSRDEPTSFIEVEQ